MSMLTNARPVMRAALPEVGLRDELVAGIHLVAPAPRAVHQWVLCHLFAALQPYVARHGLGELLWSPASLSFRNDELAQPDLFLVPPTYATAEE